MGVALGCTWYPRGEDQRLLRFLPTLLEIYQAITIVIPPEVASVHLAVLARIPGVEAAAPPEWAWGRHLALHKALETPAGHVQYADLDRLLRWVETRPEEWRAGVSAVENSDCLIFGRTDAAYKTHPAALRETERLSNLVFSHLLGQSVDLSAGVKGFSRPAAEYIIENSLPGRALGVDAEWPVLLYQAGYEIEMMWVDGLDWESADRYRTDAADETIQKTKASLYDQDHANWASRVAVAQEILSAGLEAFQRKRRR